METQHTKHTKNAELSASIEIKSNKQHYTAYQGSRKQQQKKNKVNGRK